MAALGFCFSCIVLAELWLWNTKPILAAVSSRHTRRDDTSDPTTNLKFSLPTSQMEGKPLLLEGNVFASSDKLAHQYVSQNLKLPIPSTNGCEFASNCHSCTNNPSCRYCVWKSIDGDHFVKDNDNRALGGRCVDLKSKDWMAAVPVTGTFFDEDGSTKLGTVTSSMLAPTPTPRSWKEESTERVAFCGVLIPDYSKALTCSDIEAAALFQDYRETLQSVRSFASTLYEPNDETPSLEKVLEQAGEVESNDFGLGQLLFWFGLLLPLLAVLCCIGCMTRHRSNGRSRCGTGCCCCFPCRACSRLTSQLLQLGKPDSEVSIKQNMGKMESVGEMKTTADISIWKHDDCIIPNAQSALHVPVKPDILTTEPLKLDSPPLASYGLSSLSASWPQGRVPTMGGSLPHDQHLKGFAFTDHDFNRLLRGAASHQLDGSCAQKPLSYTFT